MIFPDVEDMFRVFLFESAGGVVVNEVPAARPSAFTRVWRSGGFAENRVLEVPVLTVEAWDVSYTAAHDRLQVCRGFLSSASAVLPLVRRVEELSGPYRDPDPDSATPRYSMSVRVTVRATR